MSFHQNVCALPSQFLPNFFSFFVLSVAFQNLLTFPRKRFSACLAGDNVPFTRERVALVVFLRRLWLQYHPVHKAMAPAGNDSFLAPASTIQKAILARLKWCWMNSTGQKDLVGTRGWSCSPSNPPPLSPSNPYQLKTSQKHHRQI